MKLDTAISKVYEMSLFEGDGNGLIQIRLGEDVTCYKISKDYFDKYKDDDDIKKKKSIYILYGKGKFYIGQAGIRKDDTAITSRIKEHLKDPSKDFVEEIVFFCDSANRWNGGELDYLEASLIMDYKEQGFPLYKEQNNETIDGYLDPSVKFKYDKHLREIRIMLDILGYDAIRKVVNDMQCTDIVTPVIKNNTSTESIDVSRELPHDVFDILINKGRGKAEVCRRQLNEWGICVNTDKFNFASYAPRGHYWMEPAKDVVDEDWTFALFDPNVNELSVFFVPKDTFTCVPGNSNALKLRADKPQVIKLEIKKDPFIDKQSSHDFSKYLVKRIHYKVEQENMDL